VGRDIPVGSGVSSRIELRLAGAFGVIREGAELSKGELGSRKSRTLLKLLAAERSDLVSLDRIVEVRWADEPPAAAEQKVASLVSRLRGVLGPGVILGGRPGYRLAGLPEVSVDLDAAAQYCERAEDALQRYAAGDAITLSTQALEAAERGRDAEVRARTLVVRARARGGGRQRCRSG
jgi:DNA-binding SARP family transcriptional activator